VALTEKTHFTKSKRIAGKTQATKRLETCSEILRLAVEAGVRVIRMKTVTTILDHLVETLPMANGTYCQPLIRNYSRCMRILLEYQPHVEHMESDRWRVIVGFCVRLVNELREVESGNNSHTNGNFSSKTPLPSTEQSSRSGTAEPGTADYRSMESTTNIAEFILCLRHLASAPNAPVLSEAQDIVSALLAFLQTAQGISRGHQDTIATINAILRRIAFENSDIVSYVIRQVLPKYKLLWQLKTTASMKDEMLITMLICQDHIARILKTNDHTFRYDIESMVETMRNEYGNRPDRDLLTLDDIRLEHRSLPTIRPCTRAFQIESQDIRAESHWSILYVTSHLSELIFRFAEGESDQENNEELRPAKKRRISNATVEYLSRLKDPDPTVRFTSLQILTFLFDHVILSEHEVEEIVQILMACVADKVYKISCWTLLSLSS
jgi:serine-protein kinase ATM